MPARISRYRFPNTITVWERGGAFLFVHHYERSAARRQALCTDFARLKEDIRAVYRDLADPMLVLRQTHLFHRRGRMFALFVDGHPDQRRAWVELGGDMASLIRRHYPDVRLGADNMAEWGPYDIEVYAMRNFIEMLG